MMNTSEDCARYYQHTLKAPFVCIGRGLHTGLSVIMTVMPAEANSGYCFVRRDVPTERNEIQAVWNNVSETHLSTTVENKMGVRVSTIEHLLAALHAMGVDNARIVLDAPEVPIMDGSADPFIKLIEGVGLVQQSVERKAIVLNDYVIVFEGEKSASLSPSFQTWIKMTIDFESSAIGKQSLSVPVNRMFFTKHIARARTFGFGNQLATLKKLGFARGGSLENAVLVKNDKVVNSEGLRFQDEFVRHKILDTIGDLALAGAPIVGFLNAKCTGHRLNNRLLRELMLTEEAYQYLPIRVVEQQWEQKMMDLYFDKDASEMAREIGAC